jgi:hypothetical protein
MLKKSTSVAWKVKVQVKAEGKKSLISLNLNLDLSLYQNCGLAGQTF